MGEVLWLVLLKNGTYTMQLLQRLSRTLFSAPGVAFEIIEVSVVAIHYAKALEPKPAPAKTDIIGITRPPNCDILGASNRVRYAPQRSRIASHAHFQRLYSRPSKALDA